MSQHHTRLGSHIVICILFATLASPALLANEVPVERARQVAVNHMNAFIADNPQVSQAIHPRLLDSRDVAAVFTESYRGEPAYYVFNMAGGGWVAVAADDAATPILAYSEIGEYSELSHPPAFDAWMRDVAGRIRAARQAGLSPTTATQREWDDLGLPTARYRAEHQLDRKVVAPQATAAATAFYLLGTVWNQGLPAPVLPVDFNMYCPCATSVPVLGCVQRTVTGCVATAMAQIMNYWHWPPHGTGSHCYTDNTYGQQCEDFGATTYDWVTMALFPISASIPAAVLMRQSGVAVNMRYGPNGSSASITTANPAMAKYFNYDCSRQMSRDRIDGGDTAWLATIIAELDDGRPVLYNATEATTGGGHAFVCDGHDDQSRLHMNWGWTLVEQALFNGYYTLDLHIVDLPGGIDSEYSLDHWANVGIHPVYLPPQVGAGGDQTIRSEDQVDGTLCGYAIDPDGGLVYRWFQGSTPLVPGNPSPEWDDVPADGIACLDLHWGVPSYPYFDVGSFELKFKAKDCANTFPRTMTLTVENSPPHVEAAGEGTYEAGDPITLGGSVWDFDGDLITTTWREGTTTLFSDTTSTLAGDTTPVALPDHQVPFLPVGSHTLTLVADDGVNPPVTEDITVVVTDTTPPVVELACDPCALWPPNHKMATVQVTATVTDNSQAACALTATVTSSEPDNGLGDGDHWPDWGEPTIDPQTGVVTIELRAERSGLAVGRVYTIHITATDPSGNATEATIDISVSHDSGKELRF